MTITEDTNDQAAQDSLDEDWGAIKAIGWDEYLEMVNSPNVYAVKKLGAERAAMDRAHAGVTEQLRAATVRLVESGEATASEAAELARIHPDVLSFWLGRNA